MKKILAVLFVTLLAGLGTGRLAADPAVQHQRTHTTYGVSLTKGYNSPWDARGLGGLTRAFTFFDSGSPAGGWYYGLGASVAGSAGGVTAADTWLATVGWMGDPAAWFGSDAGLVDLNASVSPTWGTRIQDRTVMGSAYLGLGLSLGVLVPFPVSIPLVGDGEVGLAWEPMVPVARMWGSRPVANEGYMNFALTWTMKWNTETKTLPWRE